MIVNTQRLYRRAQAGLRAGSPEVQASARSLLSYLVVHLRSDVVTLPAELIPLYREMPDDESSPPAPVNPG